MNFWRFIRSHENQTQRWCAGWTARNRIRLGDFQIVVDELRGIAGTGDGGYMTVVNGGVNIWLAYDEAKAAAVRVQQEKAQAAAERITQFVTDIEGQIGWTTRAEWARRIFADVASLAFCLFFSWKCWTLLMEALEDHDDIQNVYANFNIPDNVMAELAAEN